VWSWPARPHFLIGADGLAVAIALPTLQTGLGAAPIDAQWVLTAYGLAFGGTLLLAGRLGDLYGRRRLLVWGMAVFAGASAWRAWHRSRRDDRRPGRCRGSVPPRPSPRRWR